MQDIVLLENIFQDIYIIANNSVNIVIQNCIINTLIIPKHIQSLSCIDIKLKHIQFEDDSMLQILDCSKNNLTTLTLPTKSIMINCSYNMLSEIHLDNCKDVEHLDIRFNNISKLDLPDSIDYLYIQGNPKITFKSIHFIWKLYDHPEHNLCKGDYIERIDLFMLRHLFANSNKNDIMI